MTKQAASQHSILAPARTLPETPAKPSRRKVLKAAPGAALGAASLVPVAALASSGAGSARVSPSPDADSELFSLISAILNATDRLDEASRQFDAIKDSLKTSESTEEIELGTKISDATTQYARSVGYWLIREHVPSAPAAQGEPLFEHPARLREELDSLCVRKDELKKAREAKADSEFYEAVKPVSSIREEIAELIVRLSERRALTLEGIILKADLIVDIDDLLGGFYGVDQGPLVLSIFEDIRALRV